ncbi:hypothetical protein LCGC14_0701570 [marine sediment metagenome]|uniref:Uncharacterized protein n=1 Tax=marine sediment metagenome TaxID=412755 RepID=A0A0F9QMC1_9ZZZZ
MAETVRMSLASAKWCSGCDTIHNDPYQCPCGDGPSYFISQWVPLVHRRKEEESEGNEDSKVNHANS